MENPKGVRAGDVPSVGCDKAPLRSDAAPKATMMRRPARVVNSRAGWFRDGSQLGSGFESLGERASPEWGRRYVTKMNNGRVWVRRMNGTLTARAAVLAGLRPLIASIATSANFIARDTVAKRGGRGCPDLDRDYDLTRNVVTALAEGPQVGREVAEDEVSEVPPPGLIASLSGPLAFAAGQCRCGYPDRVASAIWPSCERVIELAIATAVETVALVMAYDASSGAVPVIMANASLERMVEGSPTSPRSWRRRRRRCRAGWSGRSSTPCPYWR